MTPEQRARAWYPSAAWGGGNSMANFNGAGGRFLWKPVSDSTKKCAVHTPAGVRLSSITVAGKTYGVGSIGNGYRPLFRLDKPGSAYGKGIPVVLNLHGGGVLTIIVPDGSKRFEKSGFKDTESAPAPSPVKPNPPAEEPLFRVTDSGIVFSAKAAPYIEQVIIVSGVNSKGQAKALYRCGKINAVAWSTGAPLSIYPSPAFYAVDVVDRIEHLIPHSVRGWIYVNAKGEIVQFGAKPLPPSLWPWSPSPVHPNPPAPVPPKTPAPAPAPSGNIYATLTATGLRLAPNLVPLVAKVLVLTNTSTPSKTVKYQASRAGDEWSTGQPLSAYPDAVYQIFWKVEPPAHIPHHQGFPGSIKNVSHITQAGRWNPPTTR